MCELSVQEQHVELKIEPTAKWLANFYRYFPVISLCVSKKCAGCKKEKLAAIRLKKGAE
jgi:hypothetical protein